MCIYLLIICIIMSLYNYYVYFIIYARKTLMHLYLKQLHYFIKYTSRPACTYAVR